MSAKRADAWFQIRFGSNKDALTTKDISDGHAGTAARRDAESTIFGLYSPQDSPGGLPPLTESMAIYAEFSDSTATASMTNRAFAFAYENIYASGVPGKKNAVADGNTDLAAMQPLKPGESLAQIQGLTVQTFEDSLTPAATTLIDNYVVSHDINPFLSNGASLFHIDSLDVQVATLDGDDDLIAAPRNGYNLKDQPTAMTYHDSLLVAQGGNDTLDGTGTANDVLIGGTGDDTILGGAGNDYIVAGTGNDYIHLTGAGNDTVVLGTSGLHGSGGHDTVDAMTDTGTVAYYLAEGSVETIDLGGGSSTFNVVRSNTSTQALSITGQYLGSNLWYDPSNHAFLSRTGTGAVTINYLPEAGASTAPSGAAGSQPVADASGVLQSILDFFIPSAQADELTSSQIHQVYQSDDGGASHALPGIQLTLNNFTGNSDGGITLGAAPAPPAAPVGTLVTKDYPHASTEVYSTYTEIDYTNTSPGAASILIGPNDASTTDYWFVDGSGFASSMYGGSGSQWLAVDYQSLESTINPAYTAVDTLAAYVKAGDGTQEITGDQGNDTLIGGTSSVSTGSFGFAAGGGPLGAYEQGAYTLQGSVGFDWISGGGGDSWIQAGATSSLLMGGAGSDTIIGGGGNDTIVAGESYYPDGGNVHVAFNVYKSDSSDTLPVDFTVYGAIRGSGSTLDSGLSTKANLIVAGSGNDLILGSLGNDTIYGGQGNDTIVGDGGSKTIYVGSGNSVVHVAEDFAGVVRTGISWQDAGKNDSSTVYGGGGNETIYGSGGRNEIYAGGGNDVINIGNGNSYVYGDTGNNTIVGGTGNDVIDLGGGNDVVQIGDGKSYVYAGLGESTITAGAGSDTVEAGGGSDTFIGGTGDVTYVIGMETGTDTVRTGAGKTTIEFVGGVDEHDLITRRDTSGNLVLSDASSDTSVTIQGYFGNGSSVSVAFQDGTAWQAKDILAASILPSDSGGIDTLWGSDGNDSIVGGSDDALIVGTTGANTLVGGTGNNTIRGSSGSDTIDGGVGTTSIQGGSGKESYAFTAGDGSSTIAAYNGAGGHDTLAFGTGIVRSDTTFAQLGANDLLITVNDTIDGLVSTIDISGYFSANPSSTHAVDAIHYADGTSLGVPDVSGSLTGFYGNGSDDGYVTSTVVGANYYAGNGNHVEVQGGPGADLVVGGTGTDTLFGGSGASTIDAGTGNDLIQGGAGNDLVNLSSGQATVYASGGNDTYSWDGEGNVTLVGYGPDTNHNYVSSNTYGGAAAKTGSDVLSLGPDVSLNDLTFRFVDMPFGNVQEQSRDGLIIGVAGTGASLTINALNELDADGTYGFQAIAFADGTGLTVGQILDAAALDAAGRSQATIDLGLGRQIGVTGAHDTVNAGGNDTIVATSGTDRIVLTGQNTVIFGRSSGQTTVDLNAGAAVSLSLAADVMPQDIQVTRTHDTYVISIRGTDKTLTIDGTAVFDQVSAVFANGTLWNAADIADRATQPLDGGQTLAFGHGSGLTVLNGDGLLSGTMPGSTPSEPVTVQMALGIRASDIRVTTQWSPDNGGSARIVLSLAGTSDRIVADPASIAGVQFSDGTHWSPADIDSAALSSSASGGQYLQDVYATPRVITAQGDGDTLVGGPGADTLDPGTGSTQMIAGPGSTVFLYAKGDGNDTISLVPHLVDATPPSGAMSPSLHMGAGISLSDLQLSAQGMDLIVHVRSTGKSIDIEGFLEQNLSGYGGYKPGMDILLADGTRIGGLAASSSTLSDSLGGTVLVGDANADTITSSAGHDVIFAGSGETLIHAGSGNDTIVASNQGASLTVDDGSGNNVIYTGAYATTLLLGSGSNDTIEGNGTARVVLGTGIHESDIVITHYDTDPSDVLTQQYAQVNITSTGQTFYIDRSSEATLVFADGTSLWTGNMGLTAANPIPELSHATYSGVYTPGNGLWGHREADIDPSGFALTFNTGALGSPVTTAAVSGDGASIDIGGFKLDNYYHAATQADGSTGYVATPVTVSFADGTTWNAADVAGRAMSAGDIWLTHSGGQSVSLGENVTSVTEMNTGNNDILVGSAPGKLAINLDGLGQSGNDTIDLGSLYANVNVTGFSSSDVVDFEAGITAGALTFQDELSALVVTGANGTLTLRGFFDGSGNPLWNDEKVFKFADGTTASYTDVMGYAGRADAGDGVAVGTAGNDTIAAGMGNQTLIGSGGNDALYAGSGVDTFVFDRNTGHSTIHGVAEGGQSTLKFAAGVSSSDVAVYQADAGGTLVLRLLDSDTVITLPGYLNQGALAVIGTVSFADGTTWSQAQLTALAESPSPFSQYLVARAGAESIAAGAGTDTLASSGGTDTLVGGTGRDTLMGGAGTDLLIAGSGDELLVGGVGHETFVVGSGIGHDTLVFQDQGSNKLTLSPGINSGSVAFSSVNGSDLTLSLAGGGDVTLANALVSKASTALTIVYGDGSAQSLSSIEQSLPGYLRASPGHDSLAPGAGNDTLVGDTGADTLVAGNGSDTLVGGSGSTRVIAGTGNSLFQAGSGAFEFDVGAQAGRDTISANAPSSGTNIVKYTTDIASLAFSRESATSASTASSALLELDATDATGWTSTLTLTNHYAHGVATSDVSAVQFDDGSSINVASIEPLLDQLDPGASVVLMGHGDQTASLHHSGMVIVGSGNDVINGGDGSDVFRFASGFGHDTLVTEPGYSDNSIQIATTTLTGTNLSFARDGVNLVVYLNGSVGSDGKASSIVIANHYASGTTANDLSQVTFDDGTVVTMAQINQLLSQSSGAKVSYAGSVLTAGSGNVKLTADKGDDTLVGGAGIDTLIGSSGMDVLQAGTGNTSLVGGTGTQVYQFSSGFGQDTLAAKVGAKGNSIRLSTGISASNLTFQASGNNLVISLVGSTGANGKASSITLTNHFANGVPVNDVGQLIFADGSTIAMSEINALLAGSSTLNGTVAQVLPGIGHVLTAPGGADTLTGDASAETLNGGSGADVIRAGSGRAVINAGTSTDTLVGGSGADIINVATTVAAAEFIQAGSGNETINDSGSGAATIVGGSGVDVINGGKGATTYDFNPGFGQSTINDAGGTNSVAFGAGISTGDVTTQQSGNDLLFKTSSGGIIDMAGWYSAATPVLKKVTFSNGSIWNMGSTPSAVFNDYLVAAPDNHESVTGGAGADTLVGDANADVLTAGTGNQKLTAGTGADTLVGGSGIDTLTGGSGNDLLKAGTGTNVLIGGSGVQTYVFNTGFGQDTLTAGAASANNTLQFGSSIATSAVSFAKSGNNLVVSVNGSVGANGKASSITLVNHFVSGAPIVDVGQVVFGDGTRKTMAQINQQFTSTQTKASVAQAQTRSLAVTPSVAQLPTDTHKTELTVSPSALNDDAPRLASVGNLQATNSETGVNGGPPLDRMLSDPYDLANDAALPYASPMGSSELRQSTMFGSRTASRGGEHRRSLVRTATAANDIIAAMSAQVHVADSSQLASGKGSPTALTLHDGTPWIVGDAERSLLGTAGGRDTSAMSSITADSTTLAQQKLVNAMAAFSPSGSAETHVNTDDLSAFAVTLATRSH